jgi:hypothetical protein
MTSPHQEFVCDNYSVKMMFEKAGTRRNISSYDEIVDSFKTGTLDQAIDTCAII